MSSRTNYKPLTLDEALAHMRRGLERVQTKGFSKDLNAQMVLAGELFRAQKKIAQLDLLNERIEQAHKLLSKNGTLTSADWKRLFPPDLEREAALKAVKGRRIGGRKKRK